MAQTQLIKRRIRSVSNTRQITKAMELVAASRMRRAQEAALHSRAYTNSATEILARLSQLTDAKKHALFVKRRLKTCVTILITSDRGLAGAYNSNLLRAFSEALKNQSNLKNQAIVIGQKGARFVSHFSKVDVIGVYVNWPNEPTSNDVRPISHTIIDLYSRAKVDQVQVIYTDYISTIRQEVKTFKLLPITPLENETAETQAAGLSDATFEPSPIKVLEAIVPRLVEAQLYQVVLEAAASEQSMRMMAMKNASDNATDLIDDLTLAYNGARQAGITQELAEITAGAEAIT